MEKEFEIKKIDEDSYELISLTNDEKITFKKNVKLAKEIANVNADAKLDMIMYMKEKGITKNDLIVETVNSGKKYYDESMYKMLEETFVMQSFSKLVKNISNILFGLSLEELIEKIGLKTTEESSRLGKELTEILQSKKPRES